MLRWILIISLVLAASISSVFASQLDSHFQEVVGPFPACSKINMVTYNDFQKYPNLVRQYASKLGPSRIQALSHTGFFEGKITPVPKLYGTDRPGDIDPVVFLKEIGSTVDRYFDGSIARVQRIVACFAQAPGANNFISFMNLTGDQERYMGAMLLKKAFHLPEAGPNGCAKLRTDVKAIIQAKQSLARIELAMSIKSPIVALPESAYSVYNTGVAKTDHDFVKGTLPSSSLPTRENAMRNSGSYRPNDNQLYSTTFNPGRFPGMLMADGMPALTPHELAVVRGTVHEFNKNYNPSLDRWDSHTREGPLPLLESFFTYHRLRYYDYLQQVPALAYLGQTNLAGEAGDKAVFWASVKLLENASKAKGRIQSSFFKAGLEKFIHFASPSNAQSASAWKMINFMVYQNTVEDALKANPRRCAVATSLMRYNDDHNLRFMVTVGGALLVASVAVSVVAPPATLALPGIATVAFSSAETAALILGPPIGFAFTAQSYYNYKHVEQDTLNTVIQEKGVIAPAKPEQVVEARDAFYFQAALEPLDWMGTGVIGKLSVLTAAKMGLRAEGVTAREMTLLWERAAARDGAQAAAARAKIKSLATGFTTKLFGGKPLAAEESLVKAMGDKGFLGTTERPTMQFLEVVAEKLRALSPARRERVALRAQAILERVNKARFNDANRASAIRVVEAAAEFGVTDTSQIVQVLNTWDQGFEGLAKSYSAATKKLRNPEFLERAEVKAATPARRQQLAFDEVLGDELNNSAAYKAMSEEERAAARKQMCICSGTCHAAR